MSVRGRLIPVALNNEPATEIDDIVSAAFPEDESVTIFAAVWPTFTAPNATVVLLIESAGVYAFNCIPNLADEPFALAVRFAV